MCTFTKPLGHDAAGSPSGLRIPFQMKLVPIQQVIYTLAVKGFKQAVSCRVRRLKFGYFTEQYVEDSFNRQIHLRTNHTGVL